MDKVIEEKEMSSVKEVCEYMFFLDLLGYKIESVTASDSGRVTFVYFG